MPNNNRALVLTVLSRHIGKGNGISARQLEQQTDLMARHIRTHISDLLGQLHVPT